MQCLHGGLHGDKDHMREGDAIDEADYWDEDAVFDGQWSVARILDEVGKGVRPLMDQMLEVC